MLFFLRKIIPLRRHIINTISPSTSQQFLCVQSQWVPARSNFRYCSSISPNENSFTVSYRSIMRRCLNKQLFRSIGHIQHLFQSNDTFIKALLLCSGILINSSSTLVMPNLKLLREAGVPESKVIKFLQLYPRTITISTDRFNIIVKEVGEMGFDPLKHQFITAVYALSSMSKCTWSKRANVYKKWGWSENDIVVAFRRYPFCMKVSEDKIDAILEYLIHQLGCNSSNIIKYPYVLGFSLKKRIVPRGAVFQVLLSKGLVKKELLLGAVKLYEKDFLRRFVFCHDLEASELFELYQSKLDLARETESR